MRVEDLCVCDVAACDPGTPLSRAASLMRRYEVGCLPVVDDGDRVVGIITDRDIALELGRNRSAAETPVEDVMTEEIATIRPEDEARDALREMSRSRVRRLAVVDDDDRLQGILSIDDLVCHAAEASDKRDIPAEEVVEALARISEAYTAETGARHGRGREKESAESGRSTPRAGRRLQEAGRRGRNGGRSR